MKKKVPVSTRAVVQRINRKLATSRQRLKSCRGERWRTELGDYYLVDVERNCVVANHVDLTERGHELGVPHEWEAIADE